MPRSPHPFYGQLSMVEKTHLPDQPYVRAALEGDSVTFDILLRVRKMEKKPLNIELQDKTNSGWTLLHELAGIKTGSHDYILNILLAGMKETGESVDPVCTYHEDGRRITPLDIAQFTDNDRAMHILRLEDRAQHGESVTKHIRRISSGSEPLTDAVCGMSHEMRVDKAEKGRG